jgi:hypothetical protein
MLPFYRKVCGPFRPDLLPLTQLVYLSALVTVPVIFWETIPLPLAMRQNPESPMATSEVSRDV